jgi:hypothetical protein
MHLRPRQNIYDLTLLSVTCMSQFQWVGTSILFHMFQNSNLKNKSYKGGKLLNASEPKSGKKQS